MLARTQSGDDVSASNAKTRDSNGQPFDPRHGYDLIAPHYESWRWSEFWRQNEAPIILGWLASLKPGVGLDAGSGTGPYVSDMLKFNHRCVAVDISPKMLTVSQRKRRLEDSSVLYLEADITNLPFKEKTFDWILCSRVLSHIADIRPAVGSFVRLLKEGGECLISDVHPDHPYSTVQIKGAQTKIAIQTFKHPVDSIKRAISGVPQSQLLCFDEYYLNDLRSEPSRVEFKKLYDSPKRAIFYVCRFMRARSRAKANG